MKNKRETDRSSLEKKIKIDLSWKVWSLIVGFLILLGFTGFGYSALGSVPEMGHSVNELQKCGPNEILKMDSTGTSWSCQSASSGTLSCVKKSASMPSAKTLYSLSCDEGYSLTGTAVICDNGGSSGYAPQAAGTFLGNQGTNRATGVCIGTAGTSDVQKIEIICCKVV